jgi:phenylpyruvate tautomerase PptA (4-oxalocrotonate tautomerase family)
MVMPLVDIQLIEGVLDKSQKQEMIRKVTDVMVEIEGAAMRGVTWVRVQNPVFESLSAVAYSAEADLLIRHRR